MIPFPDKKYSIIYADPPWSYIDKEIPGGAFTRYDTQSNDWVRDLPVREIADDNCVLFIWVTAPKLNENIWDIIKSWGFEYKTVAFTWVKTNKVSKSFFWGLGRWTRANAEFCLIATKGNPKRVSMGVHSVVCSPVSRHSEKPDEVRQRIVQLMGDIPRIELFARQKIEGWDVWGNEAEAEDLGMYEGDTIVYKHRDIEANCSIVSTDIFNDSRYSKLSKKYFANRKLDFSDRKTVFIERFLREFFGTKDLNLVLITFSEGVWRFYLQLKL